MEITTKSGNVTINKRTNYGKWLIGYTSTDAWSGWHTIEATWNEWKDKKPQGCSWQAWGVICGQHINPLYSSSQSDRHFIKELREDWAEIETLLKDAGIKIPMGLYINKIDDFYNFK